MRIAMIGLGKLGLPVALAMESRGHDVVGCETNTEVRKNIQLRHVPYREEGTVGLLSNSRLGFVTPSEAVEHADIVFVAVQTPHEPEFEGCTPLPEDRADFDYSYLKEVATHVADAAVILRKPVILAIISTVLPNTLRHEIIPLLNGYVRLVYNPSFIAMGSAIRDFLDPEFVLLGSDNALAVQEMVEFYQTIHDKPIIRTGLEEAELTKVAYNTFITSKIVFANALMEICEEIGADVDEVTCALAQATDRLISPRYLRAGMGDGGGCHPRDNIALSWLARELDLSFDLFGMLMQAREKQTDWLTGLIRDEAVHTGLPITILGKAFKAGTNITTGSAAVLLANLLAPDVDMYDPYVDEPREYTEPRLFFVATNHPEFADFSFPGGSVVLDPWGYIPLPVNVRVRRIGRGRTE